MADEVGMGAVPEGASSAYAHSFGYMPSGTRYYAPELNLKGEIKGYDDRVGYLRERFMQGRSAALKALTTTSGGSGTAGTAALVPVYVDPRIVDQSRKYTPFVEITPRVSNMGLTADFNIISAKGAAVAAIADAALSDVTDTESRTSATIKFLYSIGRVVGPMQAAMPAYMMYGMTPDGSGLQGTNYASPNAPDAKQYELLKRARALKELEENLFWVGNKTTSGVSGNPNGAEYDGLIALQSTTNQTDNAGAALAWSQIETALKNAYIGSGRPSVAGCSPSAYVALRSILIDSMRLRPSDMTNGDVAAGIASRLTIETMVGPVQMLPSQYLSETAAARRIHFLDMDVVETRVLQDMTYQPLAQTNDSEKFMLKEYIALILRAAGFCASIKGIA